MWLFFKLILLGPRAVRLRRLFLCREWLRLIPISCLPGTNQKANKNLRQSGLLDFVAIRKRPKQKGEASLIHVFAFLHDDLLALKLHAE